MKHLAPIGQITLEVTFGMPFHYRCELIPFEVVPFTSRYDAVLGRTSFAKFMEISNYTYMKLKMPGPRGVISIHESPSQALLAEWIHLAEDEARMGG